MKEVGMDKCGTRYICYRETCKEYALQHSTYSGTDNSKGQENIERSTYSVQIHVNPTTFDRELASVSMRFMVCGDSSGGRLHDI